MKHTQTTLWKPNRGPRSQRLDQLRNGYQRYLREYRKFVSVNLNETGNSKAPLKQEWFDELHGLLSSKLGLAATSFGSSEDSDNEDLAERMQTANRLLLKNISDEDSERSEDNQEAVGVDEDNGSDPVKLVQTANDTPPVALAPKKCNRKRNRTSAPSSTASIDGDSDLVEPADLPSAVAAVRSGISDGMNGMAASFGKIADALKSGSGSQDNASVLRAVEVLAGKIREQRKEQSQVSKSLLDVLSQIATKL
ncbi:hypothetical protein BDR26DRAFT_943933 [Obelidium mucronatum]|nr:hypothetical protein BDR26DRAFT_943933 [Obelidium mucronatum]